MYLILTRHGHRDTSDPHLDNGLTAKGEEQARRLSEYFGVALKSKVAADTTALPIYTSAKIRCRETIAPLCHDFGLVAQIHEGLTEGSVENGKLVQFITEWKAAQKPWTLICSHGDVLPYLFFKLTGERVSVEKAGIALIEWPAPTLAQHSKLQGSTSRASEAQHSQSQSSTSQHSKPRHSERGVIHWLKNNEDL